VKGWGKTPVEVGGGRWLSLTTTSDVEYEEEEEEKEEEGGIATPARVDDPLHKRR
jgi:hypothetical protein